MINDVHLYIFTIQGCCMQLLDIMTSDVYLESFKQLTKTVLETRVTKKLLCDHLYLNNDTNIDHKRVNTV